MTQRILTAAILIPFVVLAILLIPLPIFLVTLDLLLFFSLREFGLLLVRTGTPRSFFVFFPALLLPWVSAYKPPLLGPFVMGAVLLILSWNVFVSPDAKSGLGRAAGSVLTFLYLSVPLSLAAAYHAASYLSVREPTRPFELVYVLSLIWISDAGAYFTGRLVGRRRITPRISPQKTVEGFIAGLVFPVTAALAAGEHLIPEKSLLFLVSSSLTVAIFGMLGDLFESMLKRAAELKDTSSLIPGHGGILDRIDSLLFAFPAYQLLTCLLE